MIKGFSGEGAAKVADSALHEIHNDLTWHSEFQQLYSRKQVKPYRSISAGSNATTDEESSHLSSGVQHGILQRPLSEKAKRELEESATLIVPAPIKRNQSHVLCISGGDSSAAACNKSSSLNQVHHSPLFWWIVVLIVIPLLLLIGLICGFVSRDIVTAIPSWVSRADQASDSLAKEALNLTVASKASLLTAVVFEPVRDLYLMTRLAGWLYFGGIKRSPAFTEVDTAAEECKVYYSQGVCPYHFSDRTPCSCEWADIAGENCTKFNLTESRNLQVQGWALQSQDADPETGQHLESSSFPFVGSSPNTTQWWPNASVLPGSEKGAQASGYSTSYDRLRVASALAIAQFPVYNYAHNLGFKNQELGLYMALEEDGLMLGFKGCQYDAADFAFWNSTEDNQAADVAPSLCPIGKYGYDPRCRDWYASGKDHYMSLNVSVHITAPYVFAIRNDIAASATAAVANPNTGEYVGQTLLDFYPEGVKHGLEGLGGIIPVLITPDVDATGGDTVVGPNMTSGWKSASILDLLFEHDGPGTPNRTYFEQNCLVPMKNGSSGLKNFWRTKQDGNTEHLIIAFAPVYQRFLLPVNPDDFSRGVEVSKVLVYSVGMIRKAEDIHAPFAEIVDEIQMHLNSIQKVYIIVTIIVAVLFTAFTCIVSTSDLSYH